MAGISISRSRWRIGQPQKVAVAWIDGKADEAQGVNVQDPMRERIQSVLEKTSRIWGLDDFSRLDETAGWFGAPCVTEHIYARGTAPSFHWIMAL